MTINGILHTIAGKDFRNYAKYLAVQVYNCLYKQQTYRLPTTTENIVRGYDTMTDQNCIR